MTKTFYLLFYLLHNQPGVALPMWFYSHAACHTFAKMWHYPAQSCLTVTGKQQPILPSYESPYMAEHG